jgi:hypothetical protein
LPSDHHYFDHVALIKYLLSDSKARDKFTYGFNIILIDSFDNTVKRVTEALKTEGFGAY